MVAEGASFRRLRYHAAVVERASSQLCQVVLAVLAVSAVSSGCGTLGGTAPISLSYQAQAPVARLPGAESVQVKVVVNDLREQKDWVCARSGRQVENARQATDTIASTTAPAGLVSQAIKAELSHRGFDIDYRGVQVVANLVMFLCYPSGPFSIEATVGIDISVYPAGRAPAGQQLFYRYIEGERLPLREAELWSSEFAKPALEAALGDSMKRLFGDRRFINALLSPAARTPAPAPNKTPPPPMLYDPKAL
jgi:hypothetical protein